MCDCTRQDGGVSEDVIYKKKEIDGSVNLGKVCKISRQYLYAEVPRRIPEYRLLFSSQYCHPWNSFLLFFLI